MATLNRFEWTDKVEHLAQKMFMEELEAMGYWRASATHVAEKLAARFQYPGRWWDLIVYAHASAGAAVERMGGWRVAADAYPGRGRPVAPGATAPRTLRGRKTAKTARSRSCVPGFVPGPTRPEA